MGGPAGGRLVYTAVHYPRGRAVRHQPIARLGGRANKAGACRGGSCIPIPENVVVAWNHESSGPKARAFSQSSYVTRAASMYLAIWRLSGVDGVSRIESVAAGRMTERLRFNRYTSQKIPQTPALPAFSPPPPDEAEPCGHATDSEHAHGRRFGHDFDDLKPANADPGRT